MVVQVVMIISILVVPVVMILVGMIFRKNAPKEINSVVGYRTKNSMKSQEAWEYANKALGESWLKLGISTLIVSAIAGCVSLRFSEQAVIGVCLVLVFIQVIIICVSVLPIEKQLKEKF